MSFLNQAVDDVSTKPSVTTLRTQKREQLCHYVYCTRKEPRVCVYWCHCLGCEGKAMQSDVWSWSLSVMSEAQRLCCMCVAADVFTQAASVLCWSNLQPSLHTRVLDFQERQQRRGIELGGRGVHICRHVSRSFQDSRKEPSLLCMAPVFTLDLEDNGSGLAVGSRSAAGRCVSSCYRRSSYLHDFFFDLPTGGKKIMEISMFATDTKPMAANPAVHFYLYCFVFLSRSHLNFDWR